MQIELGKYYSARNGMIIGPMAANLKKYYGPEWKWTAEIAKSMAGGVWRDDGTFGSRTEYDLIKEVFANEF